jgi:hypothetical protein
MALPEHLHILQSLELMSWTKGKSYFASGEQWAVSFVEYWNFVWWNMPNERGVQLNIEIFIDKFSDKNNL